MVISQTATTRRVHVIRVRPCKVIRTGATEFPPEPTPTPVEPYRPLSDEAAAWERQFSEGRR